MTTEYRGHGGHQAESHAEGTRQKGLVHIDVENAWRNGKDQGYVKGWNEGYQQGLIDGRNEVRESVERACTDVFGGGRVGGGYFQKPGDGGGGKS